MIIKPEQSKAARNLLKWRIEDLIAHAEITPDQARNFEQGRSRSLDVIEAIHRAFSDNGIRFTYTGGVDIEKDRLFIYEGSDHYLDILRDAHEALKKSENKEFLLLFASDSLSPPEVNDKYREMRADGIKMRQIICEADNYIMGSFHEYRQIKEDLFPDLLTVIFGDMVVQSYGSDQMKSTLQKDAKIAVSYRKIFEMVWQQGTEPTFTNAGDRFE